MKKIQKIETFEDRTKIKAVHPRFSDIPISQELERKVRDKYDEILKLESQLSEIRMAINEMEQNLSSKKKEFKALTEICNLEFETYTKEITDYEATLLLKNVGNDIIGIKNN